MAKKKSYIKVKRRLLLFGSLSIVIIVFCFSNAFSYYNKIQNLEKEKENLGVYIEELNSEEEKLADQITKLSDPDYIARYARENYLYSKEGEIIIVLPDP